MARNQGKSTNVNWGICTNTSGKEDGTPCSKCQNKEKQAIRATKDFVCEECHEPLTKIAPPKKTPWGLFSGIVVVVIGLGVGGYFLFNSNKAKKEAAAKAELERLEAEQTEAEAARLDSINKAIEQDSIQQLERLQLIEEQRIADSTRVADSLAKAKKAKPVANTGKWGISNWNGVATYDGPMEGGKPHGGGGTLIFKSSYTMDLKDGHGTKLYIKPGESFHNIKMNHGVFLQGEYHQNDGGRSWKVIGR